jgi:hypothetical protein
VPGEGLVKSSLLLLPEFVAPPDGYTRLGSYTQDMTNLDSRGKAIKSQITIVIWQKI